MGVFCLLAIITCVVIDEGAVVEAGRRGGVSTRGSFSMAGRGNRAGNDETELQDAMDHEDLDPIKDSGDSTLDEALQARPETRSSEDSTLDEDLQPPLLGETFDSATSTQEAYHAALSALQTLFASYNCGGRNTAEFVVESDDGSDLCVQLRQKTSNPSKVCANATTALWHNLTPGGFETHTFNFGYYDSVSSHSNQRGIGWSMNDASSPLYNVFTTGANMTGLSLTEWDDYGPGCYYNLPAGGCPNRTDFDTGQYVMERDFGQGSSKQNSNEPAALAHTNESICEGRKSLFDTWCGNNNSEFVFIAANSTLKWSSARCKVMMRRGKQVTTEFKRNTVLYKVYFDFLKVSACANIAWKYRNGTVDFKGQDCGVNKIAQITHYESKCIPGDSTCLASFPAYENWTYVKVFGEDMWLDSDAESFVSQFV